METSFGLDKALFFEVYRNFRPWAIQEEYERDWNEFQRAKTEHLKQKGLQ